MINDIPTYINGNCFELQLCRIKKHKKKRIDKKWEKRYGFYHKKIPSFKIANTEKGKVCFIHPDFKLGISKELKVYQEHLDTIKRKQTSSLGIPKDLLGY